MALNDLVGTNIHNQQFIDPGVGQFNPPSQLMGIGNHQYIPADSNQGGLPMGQHPLMSMPPYVDDFNTADIQMTPPPVGIQQIMPDYSNQFEKFGQQLGGFGNQIASLENMQQAQPQEVTQPQRPAFNPFNPFGFGGLGSLFGRRY